MKARYMGCYSCNHFHRETPAAHWGSCSNPVKNPQWNVALEYILKGWWDYPEFYFPTGMVCGIDDCPNWISREEAEGRDKSGL